MKTAVIDRTGNLFSEALKGRIYFPIVELLKGKIK